MVGLGVTHKRAFWKHISIHLIFPSDHGTLPLNMIHTLPPPPSSIPPTVEMVSKNSNGKQVSWKKFLTRKVQSFCFGQFNLILNSFFFTFICALIEGLDPARPLVENHASQTFRLTRDDAKIVQVIHTNAGKLGQLSSSGTVDFCVNGGRQQPYCKGHPISK